MGIATELEVAIDQLLVTFVSSKSAALCGALVPIALTGATIYLLVMGFAIMRGEANDSLHTFLWKSFKMAFIAGLALSVGEYQASIVDGITGIQGAFLQSMSGVSSVGGLVDNMAAPFLDLIQQLWSQATVGFWPNFSLLAAAGLVQIAQIFLFVVGLGFYLLTKVALALVFAVGPAFILCAMWPATQKYTESWVGQALNYVVLNVLIGASIVMLTGFASQYANHIAQTPDTANVIKATMALLLCSGALGVVMLNLPQLATALSGGASISGIGRAIGRAGMDMGRGSKKDGPMPAGGDIRPARNTGSTQSTGREQSQPLYLRHTIDNIRRAA